MKRNQTFGQAIEALKQGQIARREGWTGFIFRQVPSKVPAETIPKMTSLPPAVKAKLIATGEPITYQNQLAIVCPDNSIHGWQPTVEDSLAADWEIDGEHVVASETVGTATPLQ